VVVVGLIVVIFSLVVILPVLLLLLPTVEISRLTLPPVGDGLLLGVVRCTVGGGWTVVDLVRCCFIVVLADERRVVAMDVCLLVVDLAVVVGAAFVEEVNARRPRLEIGGLLVALTVVGGAGFIELADGRLVVDLTVDGWRVVLTLFFIVVDARPVFVVDLEGLVVVVACAAFVVADVTSRRLRSGPIVIPNFIRLIDAACISSSSSGCSVVATNFSGWIL